MQDTLIKNEEPVGQSPNLAMARQQFSRIGLCAFAIMMISSVLQVLISFIGMSAWPDGNFPSWFIWVATFAPMYLGAVPLGLLIIRKLPCKVPEQHDPKPSQMVVAVLISFFMMYGGNLVGNIITGVLTSLFGMESYNPILSYAMDDSVFLKILFMVVLAPMIEEFIFRKMFIDRMLGYGEALAVVTSALMFGLFHGNLSQFFYASALGLVLGYVYIRTGKLRYSISLHMLVNFMGSVVSSAVTNNLDMDAIAALNPEDPASLAMMFSPQMLLYFAFSLLVFGLMIAGCITLILYRKKVYFNRSETDLPKGTRFKTVFLNVGMILMFIACLISILMMFFQ